MKSFGNAIYINLISLRNKPVTLDTLFPVDAPQIWEMNAVITNMVGW